MPDPAKPRRMHLHSHRPASLSGVTFSLMVCAGSVATLQAQINDCIVQTTHAVEIVCESSLLPLELIGFSEYLPPPDPGEIPRKYLVERWSGLRQVHHIHSGGSFTQRLTFHGEWRFDPTTGLQTTDKSIDFLIHRYATNTDEQGTCANLKTGINALPGGSCSDYSCGPFTLNPTRRFYEPSGSLRCANGFGELWTSEDSVAEELMEPDTEANAMIRALAKDTPGTSNHSFANDFERNWESHDRTKPVPFPARKVRFFVNFPPTCPGTYTVVYAYHKWPIGAERPIEPNHFETETVTFTEWSTRAPGPAEWIEIPLEKGMNIEIVAASLTNSCDASAEGTVETNLSSVDLSISLGSDPTGLSHGLLLLQAPEVGATLGQPESLTFWNTSPDFVEVSRSAGGALESIRTPRRLVKITPIDDAAYRIDHFRLTDGEDPPEGAVPVIRQTFTYLETDEERVLQIVEDSFGRTTRRDYRSEQTTARMTLVTGDGLRREILERATDESGLVTETRTVVDDHGQTASRRLERYEETPFGRRLIAIVLDPDSAALSSVFDYDDDPASLGQVRRRIDPDGRWWRYDYDAEGRIQRLTESFLDAPSDAPAGEVLERLFSRATVPDQDGDGIPESIETVESRALGQVIGRTFRIELSAPADSDGRAALETWDIVATTADGAWDSPSSLRTETRTLAAAPFKGRVARVRRPDGSFLIARFQQGDGLVTTLTEAGVDLGDNGRLGRGTLSSRTTDLEDNLVLEEIHDIETGVLTHRKLATAVDERGRPTRFDHLDGSFETQTHDCCGLSSGTDRNGLSFQIEYDALGRVARQTNGGVSFSYRYDAEGRVVEERRADPAGQADRVTTSTYDPAGRLLSETDEAGRTRTFDFSTLPDGRHRETITHPDTTTTILTRARDGRPVERGGTRDAPGTIAHGVSSKGFFSRETLVGNEGVGNQSVTLFSDFAGRSTLAEYADGSSETRTYDRLGEILSLTDRDGVRHLYAHDPVGSWKMEAVDLDGNGRIDLDGTDRVTRIKRSYLMEDEAWIERTTEERWTTHSGDPEIVRISDRWLSRRQVRETRGDRTVNRMEKRLADGTLEITTTGTSQPTERAFWLENRLTRTETLGPEGEVLHSNAFSYDALGRLIDRTDSESGSQTFTYDRWDRVIDVAQNPVRDDETDSVRRTTHGYDFEGRITTIVHPDGFVETRSYDDSARLSRIDPPRRPETLFGYDERNRLVRHSTTGTKEGERIDTLFGFDPLSGAPASRTFPDGETIQWSQTPAGRAIQRVGPDGTRTDYGTDAAGDLVSITYSDPTPGVGFERDRLGRIRVVDDGHGPVWLDYDAFDRVVRESRSEGEANATRLDRSFDPAGRVTALTVTAGGTSFTTAYGYDQRGRLAEIHHPGVRLGYERSDSGRVRALNVLDAEGTAVGIRTTTNGHGEILSRAVTIGTDEGSARNLFTADRDPSGRISAQSFFGEVTWTYGYDAKGWLESAEQTFPGRPEVGGTSSAFFRDRAGNRTGSNVEGQLLVSEWNPLNQLRTREIPRAIRIEGRADPDTRVTLPGQPVVRSGPLFSGSIPVDSTGGPVWQPVDLLAIRPESGPDQFDAVVATRSHRFVPQTPETFDYDAAGRLIRDGRWEYAWDAEDRLVRMQTREAVAAAIDDPGFPRTRLEFAYDSLHRRIRKSVASRTDSESEWVLSQDTGFVYEGWTLIAELNLLDGSRPIRSYAWGVDLSGRRAGAHGVGGLAAIHDHRTGKTALPCADATGNIIALIDVESGEPVARYDYAPYGELLRLSGPAAEGNPIRFASRSHDSETGLVTFGRRYYSPSTGCWLSRDPLGEAAGPNLTAYADNDPVNRIDPIGEAVYVVTRPLGGTVLKHLAPAAVHVYLAFDSVGLQDTSRWEQEVVRQNQGSGLVDPRTTKTYKADPKLVQTLSFHPDLVVNGDERLNRFLVISTEGSYVAYNDDVDTGAFLLRKTNLTITAYPVPIHGIEEQLRIYRAAIGSRNFNNYHPEAYHPERYALTRFNCGSWVRYLLKSLGYNYSLDIRRGGLTNLGVGTDFWLGPPMRHLTEAYDAGYRDFEMLFSIPQNLQFGQGRPGSAPTRESIPYLDDHFLAIP